MIKIIINCSSNVLCLVLRVLCCIFAGFLFIVCCVLDCYLDVVNFLWLDDVYGHSCAFSTVEFRNVCCEKS